jgi:hypothetical protein
VDGPVRGSSVVRSLYVIRWIVTDFEEVSTDTGSELVRTRARQTCGHSCTESGKVLSTVRDSTDVIVCNRRLTTVRE